MKSTWPTILGLTSHLVGLHLITADLRSLGVDYSVGLVLWTAIPYVVAGVGMRREKWWTQSLWITAFWICGFVSWFVAEHQCIDSGCGIFVFFATPLQLSTLLLAWFVKTVSSNRR